VLPKRGAILGAIRAAPNMTAVTGKKASPASRALHPLQELGQEEEHGEHATHDQDPRQIGAAALTVGEEVQRRDRLLGPHLGEHESAEKGGTGDEGGHGEPVTPSVGGGADEAVDEGGHPEGGGGRSGQVETPMASFGLGQVARRQQDQRDADGHVDEQTPAPRHPGGQHPPEHQPDAATASGDGAVGADGPRPLGALTETDLQQRQRGRCGDGGADALEGPGPEQPRGRLGQAPQQRGQGEQRDPCHEHPTAPQDVAGPGAEQQQTAEGQCVGVLDP
jgi:hypothetical protein